MPDWIVNELTVSGGKGAVNAFRRRAASPKGRNDEDENSALNFQSLFQTPNDLTLEEKTAWRKENWGVSCEPVDVMVDTDGDALIYVFETAWRPPLTLLKRISQEQAELTFHLDYRCEASHWVETAVFVRGLQTS